MKQIGIKIIHLPEAHHQEVLYHLQRFIIRGDYRLASLDRQIQQQAIITLDISTEPFMPNFTKLIEKFNEEEIGYQLYANKSNQWSESTLDELDIEQEFPWEINLTTYYLLWGYLLMALFIAYSSYDLYREHDFSTPLAIVFSLITGATPFLGNGIAIYTAIKLWHWHWLHASILYLGYYLLPSLLLAGAIFKIRIYPKLRQRWYHFWYH